MQYSIVNFSEFKADDFRIDAEYWHPDFIENAHLVSPHQKMRDFVSPDILNIKSTPINQDFEYLRSSQISPRSFEYKTTRVQLGEEPERAYHLLEKGDVVVSTVMPHRNAVALIKTDGVVGSSDLAVLRSNGIQPEYLLAFCKTAYFVNCLIRSNKKSLYPAVSIGDVLDTALFVPSDSFETLIVKAIKTSIFDIDRSKQIYAQAESLLLSELGLANWRPKSQLTFVKNFSDMQRAGRIDSDYFQPRYEQVVNAIRNHPGGSDTLGNLVTLKQCAEVKMLEDLGEGIPFVRVSDLSPFEITEEKYISEELYAEMQEHQPQKDEILFSKDGAPGIAYYFCKRPKRMIPSSGILRLKSDTDKVGREYLTLVLNSILTQEQVQRDVAGSSLIPRWRLDQVAATLIPFLSKEKQIEIEQSISESFRLRNGSKKLLEHVKKTVEIAIEQGERAASNWLESIRRNRNRQDGMKTRNGTYYTN